MNIQVEDFFGNEVIKLNYCLKNKVITDDNIRIVSQIANKCGYNLEELNSDKDGIDFIVLRQVNVDNTESEEKKDLMKIINELNYCFL